MQPVPRSFQAHRPVLDEAWPAQPPGSPRYDPKQNFRLPLELEILTNRRCARAALLAQGQVSDANRVRNRPKLPNCIKITRWGCQLAKYCHQLADKTSPKDEM